MKETLVRLIGKVLAGTMALAFLVSIGRAQVNTADLKGVITDPSGAAIAGAKVKVESKATGQMRETTTRETGDYIFLGLPPGHYNITVEAANFRPAVAQDVKLTVGQQAQLPFQLQISVVKEALVVSADAALVETTRSSLATTIGD